MVLKIVAELECGHARPRSSHSCTASRLAIALALAGPGIRIRTRGGPIYIYAWPGQVSLRFWADFGVSPPRGMRSSLAMQCCPKAQYAW